MAETKYSFQLTNTEGQNPLDLTLGNSSNTQWNYTDLDMDGNGNVRLVSGQDAMVQKVLKAIFTERQNNGSYGSNIYSLVGFKSDVIVRRMSLFLDLSMCIMNLKINLDEQAQIQNLSDDDLISTINKLVVTEDPSNPTISKINLTLVNNSSKNNTIAIGIL